MAKKYLTDKFDRATTTVMALEDRKEAIVKKLKFYLNRELTNLNRQHAILYSINELRTLADLLDRPRGRAVWYNSSLESKKELEIYS